jgi:glycosyltransferase involved in cell wall biosynthesis
MKIFYIYYDFIDVMPIHAFEVMTKLALRGNHVYALCSINKNSKIAENLRFFNIDIISIPTIPLRFLMEISFLTILIIRLFCVIRKIRPDIIYIRHGSPSIIGALIGRLKKVPVCIEVNDILTKRTEAYKVNFFKKMWTCFIEKTSFPLADRIFPVTNEINKWIHNIHNVPKYRIITISNGVNIERFYPSDVNNSKKKFNLSDSEIIIGYLGSLFPWAGIESLIDAATIIISSFSSVRFVIGGGEEPYFSKLKTRVNNLGLSSFFKFYGPIKWCEASDFINTFSLAVAPIFFKNFESGISSQKILAYCACGKPVICSDIPGLKKFIEKEKIGVVFKMGDYYDLASAIIKILKNPIQIEIMGRRARTYVCKKCSWDNKVEFLEKNLSNLV